MSEPAASIGLPAPVIDLKHDHSLSARSLEQSHDRDLFKVNARSRRETPLRRLFAYARTRMAWADEGATCEYRAALIDESDRAIWQHKPYWSRSKKPRFPTVTGFVLRFLVALPVSILLIFGGLHALEVMFGHARALLDIDFYRPYLPHWGQPGHVGAGLADYPTDATRDIIPIPCHSHNDYWRRIPLFSAIHWGLTSVEADVWKFNDELFVGHTRASLTANRTFSSLYIDPLVDLLDKMNTPSDVNSTSGGAAAPPKPNPPRGVFDVDSSQTLVLLVDFKTYGAATFPAVQAQLEPLRRKNYLSHWDGDGFHSRPVTVVGTGNTPFDLVVANTTYRDIFFDAPITSMWEPASPTSNFKNDGSVAVLGKEKADVFVDGKPHNYGPSNSYYASTSLTYAVGLVWGGGFSARQLSILRGQIRGAKRRGLQARYWDTPPWPHSLRNEVWRVLVEEGVGVLNVDDLEGAAVGDWRRTVPHGWLT